MKKLILLGITLVVSFFAISCSAQTICNQEGKFLVKKSQILKAFNSVSKEHKAVGVSLSYNTNTKVHSILVFLDKENKKLAYDLQQNGNNYEINERGALVVHTCEGNPCNSCQMSSTFWTVVKCTCLQSDCEKCGCDHTVSSSHSGFLSIAKFAKAVKRVAGE